MPYSFSKFRLAEGLPLWLCAMPTGRIDIMALVCAESLERMLGMLPSGERNIPTCSAEGEKSTT